MLPSTSCRGEAVIILARYTMEDIYTVGKGENEECRIIARTSTVAWGENEECRIIPVACRSVT